jgi:hypothetical protein
VAQAAARGVGGALAQVMRGGAAPRRAPSRQVQQRAARVAAGGVRSVVRQVAEPARREQRQDARRRTANVRAQYRAASAALTSLPGVSAARVEQLRESRSPEAWAKTLPGYGAVLHGAERNYANYVRGVFGRAHLFYPGAGKKPPPVDFNTPGEDERLKAFLKFNPETSKPGTRPIHFSAADALAFIDPSKPRTFRIPVLDAHGFPTGKHRKVRASSPQQFARFVPVHELAHEYQNRLATALPYRTTAEGGAEAFARALAPALGIKVPPNYNPEYGQLARKVRRRLGGGYVNVGQFGFPWVRDGQLLSTGLSDVVRRERQKQSRQKGRRG